MAAIFSTLSVYIFVEGVEGIFTIKRIIKSVMKKYFSSESACLHLCYSCVALAVTQFLYREIFINIVCGTIAELRVEK
jgi:hypothetical protein